MHSMRFLGPRGPDSPLLELQFSGVAPDIHVPPPVWARLSEETRSLMEYAHVLHTKPLAAGWVDSFYSARL